MRTTLEPQEVSVRTGLATDVALTASLWRRPSALLAALGGSLLLSEALLAALLIGVSSSTSAALLLGLGGFVAFGAAKLLLEAPRLASLLCLVAVTLGGLAHLPSFASRLHERYWGPAFQPEVPTLGAVFAPLLAWLLVAAPLVYAAVLAWHEASSPSRNAS